MNSTFEHSFTATSWLSNSSTFLALAEWQKSYLKEINTKAGIQCLLKMWSNYSFDGLASGQYCNATWDNVYCWPPTSSGTAITRLCSEVFHESHPDYAVHLKGNAIRVCQENGSWSDGYRTNYDECAASFEIYQKTAEEERNLVFMVQHMLFFGSIVSLICLGISLTLFYMFRSLWCDRVTIHSHLMFALMLRFILLFVITEPFVLNRSSSYRDVDFVCKAIIILYLFATVASISWMFIQGLYLNIILTQNMFSNRSTHYNFSVYYFIGWALPGMLLCLYLVAMVIREDEEGCWKGYGDTSEMWILLGPMIFALVLNGFFLINILKIILQKVRSSSSRSESSQIMAAAKATMFLFPVLGINNLLLLYNPGGEYKKYYVTLNTFFGSTQGIFVSVVYCFGNRDVHAAVRRLCNRVIARHDWNLGGQRRGTPPSNQYNLETVQSTSCGMTMRVIASASDRYQGDNGFLDNTELEQAV